uniref:Uncharacterized protein n=1 Tax=Podarcis muralis TaxID=64176 RepID=A0A670HZT7_PODMU
MSPQALLHVVDLCEEATCPICLEYFRDPVIIHECGHNFCWSCLTQYWGKSEGEASCPQYRERVDQGSVRPNQQLANFVEITQKFRLLGRKMEAKGKGRVCEKHQEPLKLFCKEDESPICLVCDRAKEHKSHEAVPIEEASQEYKVGKHSGSVAEHSLLVPGVCHTPWGHVLVERSPVTGAKGGGNSPLSETCKARVPAC